MVCGLDPSRLPRSRPDLCGYATAPRRDLIPPLGKDRPLGKPVPGDLKPNPSMIRALVAIIAIAITGNMLTYKCKNSNFVDYFSMVGCQIAHDQIRRATLNLGDSRKHGCQSYPMKSQAQAQNCNFFDIYAEMRTGTLQQTSWDTEKRHFLGFHWIANPLKVTQPEALD